ncbi:hypothetical protein CU102_08700 [Phyllobacterium brassicacearum]|uniref:DUF1254 domain-containing protein n=2 Tax=Phyllobacterium brassicacearum TaxID=314235 RepID=A0A2P7BSJ6_9HYPH|nr:hypothetical protein CU102_08700 [Phyllobacterium brassicacearum]
MPTSSPTRCSMATRRSIPRHRMRRFPGYIGGFGQYRHYARAATPADLDIVTPNNDTTYSWAWLDLRREPIVFETPDIDEGRYNVFQWVDLYTLLSEVQDPG